MESLPSHPVENQSTSNNNIIPDNNKEKNINDFVYMVLDASYFIKLRPLDLLQNNKYITTQYIVNEIKDVKAREFFNLNKNFIQVINPKKESIKKVSEFAKKSNDLSYLSIADLSVIALAFETIIKLGEESLILKEPNQYQVVDKDKLEKEIKKKEDNTKKENNDIDSDSDSFEEVNNNNNNDNKKKEEDDDDPFNFNGGDDDDDEGEWITPENLESKLNNIKGTKYAPKPEPTKDTTSPTTNNNEEVPTSENKKTTSKHEETNEQRVTNVFVHSGDFTLQNVCMKMKIPIIGVDGMQIRKIKNYIYKCTTCNKFIFDNSKKFCDNCGYPYLMKIGYNIYSNGDIRINDKKPSIRKRGCQFDLPKPSLNKKGVVYILSEDQLPKKGFGKSHDLNIDKILENYEQMKEIPKLDNNENSKSSKTYVWGYPKQNPNKAKKYYSKKK